MSETNSIEIPDNVILFPKGKLLCPPLTVEELKESLLYSKMELATFLSEELTKEVCRILSDNGYMMSNIQDLGFLLIHIKSMLLRHEQISHPLQEIVDEYMSLD
jgi:hypothetical protein